MSHAGSHGAAPAANWLEAIETSAAGQAMRQSLWLYPTSEIVHLLGMVMMVGAIIVYDLRVLGFGKTLSVQTLGSLVLPGTIIGFALVFVSGLALFITEATSLAANAVFWAKLGLIVAGLANALIFHVGPYRTIGTWNTGVVTPSKARVGAAVSIAVWVLVVALGRLIAYF